MCGFCGMIGEQAEKNREAITGMMAKIVHRGPDQEGKYEDETAVLGFRRLSIIDVDHGTQPLTNETDDVVIVFNGEIYNHKEIKEELAKKGHVFKNNSDTESILHAYEEYGEKLLDRLEGMFAFVIWDKKKNKVFAARDFFGIKPFYYTFIQNTLVFGSEIKSILEYPGVEKRVNEEALEQYLSFQYSVLPETFFKGIFKLLPGNCLTFENGNLKTERYFDPMLTPDKTIPREKFVTDIERVTKDSVRRHMLSDVEVGAFLSSGVDSSYIVQSYGGAKTFTVGFGDKNGKYNEISYAEDLSREIGVQNMNMTISGSDYWDVIPRVMYHMDEPLADASCVALYFVNKTAKEQGKVKVCLSGEGADEFFGGYNIYHEPLSLKGYSRLPRFLRRAAAAVARKLPDVKGKSFLIRGSESVEERFIGNAKIFSEEERKKILKIHTDAPSAKELLSGCYDKVKNLDDISKMQYIDLMNWLPGDILLKADKMGMANSIEVRVPYLDKQVFQVARKLPAECKVDKDNTKISFRAVADRWLPKKTAEKKKLGFPTPIRVWLKQEPYYSKVKEAFHSQTAERYFNVEEIDRLLEAHREGKKDNSRKIWTVYAFLVWHQVFFEAAA